MKYEYDIVSLRDKTEADIKAILNDFGEWELVTVDDGIAYFKHPNQEYIEEIIKKQMGLLPVIIGTKDEG